jgi:hypothetical protein
MGPKVSERFDSTYMAATLEGLGLISQLVEGHTLSVPYSSEEIEAAIDRLNAGKAADEWGLAAEHLKIAKPVVVPVLCQLFNAIRILKYVPSCMKSGIITPIAKKDKSKTLMDNYRGITVTAILGKVLEHVILERMEDGQSSLQFGFTSGLSPSMAALLLSESVAETRDNGETLFVCTLDAVKAFDTVNHPSLMCKLFDADIDLESIAVIQSLYKDSASRVKWNGEYSDQFRILQGVRQGGVLSPQLYKSYIDGLLKQLEHEGDGMFIGATFVGSPTVADDVMLLAQTPLRLQFMLDTSTRYSKRERYDIHPQKSAIAQFSNTRQLTTFQWQLADTTTGPSDVVNHLGISHQGVPAR